MLFPVIDCAQALVSVAGTRDRQGFLSPVSDVKTPLGTQSHSASRRFCQRKQSQREPHFESLPHNVTLPAKIYLSRCSHNCLSSYQHFQQQRQRAPAILNALQHCFHCSRNCETQTTRLYTTRTFQSERTEGPTKRSDRGSSVIIGEGWLGSDSVRVWIGRWFDGFRYHALDFKREVIAFNYKEDSRPIGNHSEGVV